MKQAIAFVVNDACAARANPTQCALCTVMVEVVGAFGGYDSKENIALTQVKAVPAAMAGLPPVPVRTRTAEWKP